MVKAADMFLEHFARLGVFHKVLALAGPPEDHTLTKPKEDKVGSVVGRLNVLVIL